MPKKPVGNLFVQRLDAQPTLFAADPGSLREIDRGIFAARDPQPLFTTDRGTLHIGDSLRWLSSLEPKSVDLVFADPPYSIGKADWDLFPTHEDYLAWSKKWIELASRCLKPT